MFVLESRWGNDGYALWFKLLELLGASDGHSLDLSEPAAWEYFVAYVRSDSEKCHEILALLADLRAIDPDLWAARIVWSENFVAGVADVYRNRRVDPPARPGLKVSKLAPAVVSTVETPAAKPKAKDSSADEVVALWNDLFGVSLRVTDDRRRKVAARLKTFSLAELLAAVEAISRSDWHRGQNDRGWKATPEWLLVNDGRVDEWLQKKAGPKKRSGAGGVTEADLAYQREILRDLEGGEDPE